MLQPLLFTALPLRDQFRSRSPMQAEILFFVVPTVRNQALFVFLILAHERRRVLHFNVTTPPTARWTAQQLVEAFPWTDPPKYLLRDRDKIYGEIFPSRVTGMGFDEVIIAARSPWQNPYVERVIGSIRRECLEIPEIGGLHHHYERVAA